MGGRIYKVIQEPVTVGVSNSNVGGSGGTEGREAGIHEFVTVGRGDRR